MVATSGSQLLPQAAVRNLRLRLLPLTTILTPNIPEARLLLEDTDPPQDDGTPIKCVGDIVRQARMVQSLGPRYVLLKGGHVPFATDTAVACHEKERRFVVNVLCSKDQTIVFRMKYQSSKNTHGTGCSLACKYPLLAFYLCSKVYSEPANIMMDVDGEAGPTRL